jgi:DNA ligase-associated metallophosphoesterase
MNEQCASVTIRGETLWLHPERAVLWPARRTLIVSDTHFGKSALFGYHGVAVPAGSDRHDRERLSRLLQETCAARLLILGDFLHGPLASDSADVRDLAAWAAAMGSIEIRVVAGNHDRGALCNRDMPLEWQVHDLIEPPFCFTHDAERAPCDEELYTLSGHIHPVVRLAGLRKRAARVPVFWQRPSGLILPSFGLFTGGSVVRPGPGDRLFAVGPQSVVRFR